MLPMRLPAMTTLRAFEATARLGGYSAAARELNVTPAAVAQQVRKLEAEVGAALVRRKGRGLVLTEAGRQLAYPLRDAFAMMARGLDDLKLQTGSRGVRVSTTDYFGNAVVLPHIGDFWRQNPGVQVSFSPEGNTQPIDLDRYDLVVRGDAPGKQWDGYREVPLVDSVLTLSAAPALISGRDVDFCALPWIRDQSIGGDIFDRVVRKVGCNPEEIEIVDPGSAKFELEAALMGFGLSVGPELIIRKHLADGSLVKLKSLPDMRGTYYAIVRQGPLPEAVDAFLAWLVALCAPLDPDHGAT